MTENSYIRQDAASWHGLALNRSLSESERLECALKALDLYEIEIDSEFQRGRKAALEQVKKGWFRLYE